MADYVGTYADTPGHPVEILNGDEFFAVQDDAKYRLIPKGVDAFSTMYGPKLTFKRDANGAVTGYEQNGKFHPRISPRRHTRIRRTGLAAARRAGLALGLSVQSACRYA